MLLALALAQVLALALARAQAQALAPALALIGTRTGTNAATSANYEELAGGELHFASPSTRQWSSRTWLLRRTGINFHWH